MPYINIKIAKDNVSAEKKRELIKGATDLMVNVLGKNPKSVFVIVEEVDTDNWGVGGESVTELRKLL
jgi:4-oxalocrotonate tautomerase